MSKVKTCWRHLLYWLVISSSVNVKKSQVLNVKKSKKIDENMKYWRVKYLPLYSFYLNGLKNLNEIFRRDVTYEKIKNYWKAGNCFFFFFSISFFSFYFYFLFFIFWLFWRILHFLCIATKLLSNIICATNLGFLFQNTYFLSWFLLFRHMSY